MFESHNSLSKVHLLLQQGLFDDAFETLESILVYSPDSPTAFHAAGLCCFAMGKLPQALDFFQQAHSFDRLRQAPVIGLASTLVRLGRMAEGLYQYKLSLTLAAEDDVSLLPQYLDFYYNLSLWRNNRGLLHAQSAWEDGRHSEAIQLLQQYLKVRDPSAVHLMLLFRWLRLSHREAEALQTVVELNRQHGDDIQYTLLAAEVLSALDHQEAARQAEILTTNSDNLDVLLRARSLLPNVEEAVDVKLRDTLCELEPYDQDASLKQETKNYSLGLFLGYLHPNSPSIWLLPALHYLVHANIQVTLYVEEWDYWGKQQCAKFNFAIVETNNIDDVTLKYIIQRNHHKALWCVAPMGHYPRTELLLQSHNHCVGMFWPAAMLKENNQSGFSHILFGSHFDPSTIPEYAICFADHPILLDIHTAMTKERIDPDLLYIAMAMKPVHVRQYQSLIVGLLSIPAVVLSFDQCLLTDHGMSLLLDIIQDYPEYEGRIVLENAVEYLLPENAASHLCKCDAYISMGMPVYDYQILQKVTIPTIALYNESSSDYGLFYKLLAHQSEYNFSLDNTDKVINTVKNWQLSDVWYQTVTDFTRLIEEYIQPTQNLLNFGAWMQGFTVDGNHE